MSRLKHYVVIALLLFIPVQGMAAALGPLLCGPLAVDHHAQAPTHDGHEGAAAHTDLSQAPHTHGTDEESGSGHNHSLCHHILSGVPVTVAFALVTAFPVFDPFLTLFPELFFPEQPLGPPRA